MKAARYTRYGGPSVIRIQEVPTPTAKDNEIVIKVHASTVNRTDTGFRSAEYVVSRFFSGLFRPKINVLGCEFAGEIISAGRQVRNFQIGNRVFGYDDSGFGGHAEYKVMAEDGAIAPLPEGMDYATAAAMTEGSHYALGNIRAAKLKAGDTALVYGATGAIGSAAVQLLKHFGIFIVAVANTQNMSLVKSLGADEVIDYVTQDFTRTEHRFDFVFDAVGKSSFGQCKPLMHPHGVYISTELENIWLALLTPLKKGRKVLFPLPTIDKKDVLFLGTLGENGVFKPVVDRKYPFHEIAEAHRYVDTGQKTGNVVVEIIGGIAAL